MTKPCSTKSPSKHDEGLRVFHVAENFLHFESRKLSSNRCMMPSQDIPESVFLVQWAVFYVHSHSVGTSATRKVFKRLIGASAGAWQRAFPQRAAARGSAATQAASGPEKPQRWEKAPPFLVRVTAARGRNESEQRQAGK